MKADPMVTDTAARKAPPPEPEHLPCPRCDSTNTKFCYYNNYNFSQPRHFCKSCRRYWTHGGTLRDIPIGGGSRKNAKRSRTASIGATSVFSSSHHHHHDFRNFPAGASQLLVPFAADHGQFVSDAKMCGSFTSLLNTQATGLWALGGFGIGPGLDDVGFGLGKTVWPFPGALEGGPSNGSIMPAHTWHHVENAAAAGGGGGESGGDSFAFPDLAISTPGGGSFMK